MRTDPTPRWILALTGLVLLGLSSTAPAAEWYVMCDTGSGQVTVKESVDEGQSTQMGGPFPGMRTAGFWLDENCPERRCDQLGRCKTDSLTTTNNDSDGGWVAGEMTSESLSVTSGTTPSTPVTGPAGSVEGPGGPGGADLSPLMDNARTAVEGCNFLIALASADHMVNFDGEHPWLQANHGRLRTLARRQQTTEQLAWQASAELSNGELKDAGKLAAWAADIALSCQTLAVSQLVHGIDTAIDQQRRERNIARSQMASSMLPSLVDLAQVISGGTASGTYTPSRASGYSANPAATLNMGDPCAFKYQYRNQWNFEPVCTCNGYRFDQRQHRCSSN